MDLMSSARVVLRRLDEVLLDALAATAVADADPGEVMPPAEDGGGPGWTAARREAFVRSHRSRSLGADPVETVYAVLVTEPGPDGRPREVVAGAARLAPAPEPDTVEAGLWLGRSHRGPSGVVRSCEEALEALDLAGRLGLDGVRFNAAEMLVFPVLLRDRAAMADLVRT
ncbi:hypothetical protein ACG5V6_20035, partial [Streptomyces chitinivorans]